MRWYYPFVKRLSDILLSLTGLVLLSPILGIVALCIKLYDGGPVFYKQTRLTEGHKIFEIYKFRSMVVDAEKGGARLASRNDNRITPVGKFIRMTRIDELPQLINIIKGDMSVVGPRPERPEIEAKYLKELPEFELRLKVKAGLTGYAQVFGKYNTTPYDKLRLDLLYINEQSVLLDLKLIVWTIKILFIPESTEGIEEGRKTPSNISGGNRKY
ncbi:bacterial sugar transferase [[Clostridium] hylemonae DSM 15053]|uniref:Bacterial sugar transferase n=1 Tax=[Clostridium] hylemonae DSM 15053 TaxID=553973 RepID=C0C6R3_9FIRM|nr:bacterial sugar transferase [[Clostridium] hylemonae DSM 15053]